MPDTIMSRLFWLFMFLRMGWVDQMPGGNPARKGKYLPLLLPVVPSLREALLPFSAVILTGGSSGIGKSFIELCGKLNTRLVICNLSRRPPPEKIFPDDGKRLNHFPCDLARADELERVFRDVQTFLAGNMPAGQLLLINNSGFGSFGTFPEPSLPRELEMIDLNVRAVVHLTGVLLPMLKERGGAIVNIASTVAFQPTPYAATYGATKAFVLNWTVALNEELRGSGVRALAVCPGTTRTEFFRRAGVGDAATAPFAMTCEQVVEIALRALGAGRVQVVTGWRNKLMTFAGAKVPKPLAARVSGRILARIRGLEGR